MSSQGPESLYGLMAADIGLGFGPERIAVAAATHAAIHHDIVRLRQTSIPFLDGLEPLNAVQWIESGGVTAGD